LHKWICHVQGPEGTPFEGGTWEVHLDIPPEYPFKFPNVTVKTKIFHPNVTIADGTQKEGELCHRIIEEVWSPEMKLDNVLSIFCQLLKEPMIDHPVHDAAAEMYKNNKKEFDKVAKEWTHKYAKKKN